MARQRVFILCDEDPYLADGTPDPFAQSLVTRLQENGVLTHMLILRDQMPWPKYFQMPRPQSNHNKTIFLFAPRHHGFARFCPRYFAKKMAAKTGHQDAVLNLAYSRNFAAMAKEFAAINKCNLAMRQRVAPLSNIKRGKAPTAHGRNIKADYYIIPHINKDGISQQKDLYIANPALYHKAAPQEQNNKLSSLLKKQDDPRFRVLIHAPSGLSGHNKKISALLNQAEEAHDLDFVIQAPEMFLRQLRAARDRKGWQHVRFLPLRQQAQSRALWDSADLILVFENPRYSKVGLCEPALTYAAHVKRPLIYNGREDAPLAQLIRQHQCGSVISEDVSRTLLGEILNYRYEASHWFDAHQAIGNLSVYYDETDVVGAYENLLKIMTERPHP